MHAVLTVAASCRQVYIDAHILCTPSIADIDGDGHDELVAAVSYFFDREYYDNPVRALCWFWRKAHIIEGIGRDSLAAAVDQDVLQG